MCEEYERRRLDTHICSVLPELWGAETLSRAPANETAAYSSATSMNPLVVLGTLIFGHVGEASPDREQVFSGTKIVLLDHQSEDRQRLKVEIDYKQHVHWPLCFEVMFHMEVF